jgi:uncharacterized membrane protein
MVNAVGLPTIEDRMSFSSRRGRESAMNRQFEWQGSDSGCYRSGETNISSVERCLSALVGIGLIAAGLPRRSTFGMLAPLAGAALIFRGWTGYCPISAKLGIDTSDAGRIGVKAQHGRWLKQSIHVRRRADDLYRFWRDVSNLPAVMSHLESVTQLDDWTSHWVARGPLGKAIEWNAEIHNDQPGKLIAWRSLPGSQVDTAGSVRFEPAPTRDGTVVTVTMKYDPPGGKLTATIANFLGQGLEQQIQNDLARFKQAMETSPATVASDVTVIIESSQPFQY